MRHLSRLRQPSCSCRVLVLEDPPCFRWDPRRSRHSTAKGRCTRSPPALFFRHPPTAWAATSAVALWVGAEAAGLACRLPAAQLGVRTWGKVPSTTAFRGGERASAVAAQIKSQEAGGPPPLFCYSSLLTTITLWALYHLSAVISFDPPTRQLRKLRLASLAPRLWRPYSIACSSPYNGRICLQGCHPLWNIALPISLALSHCLVHSRLSRSWWLTDRQCYTSSEWWFQLPFPPSFTVPALSLEW